MAKRRSYRGTDTQHREWYLRDIREMRTDLKRLRQSVAAGYCGNAFNWLRKADQTYGRMQAHGFSMDVRGSVVFRTLESARSRFALKCLR